MLILLAGREQMLTDLPNVPKPISKQQEEPLIQSVILASLANAWLAGDLESLSLVVMNAGNLSSRASDARNGLTNSSLMLRPS